MSQRVNSLEREAERKRLGLATWPERQGGSGAAGSADAGLGVSTAEYLQGLVDGGTTGASEVPEEVKEKIRELKRKAVSPRDLWLQELEEYRDVPVEKWGFPEGYTYRLFKDVGSEFYGKDLVGEEWGEKYLRDHGAWEVMRFRTMMMTPLRTLDEMFLKEKVPVMNSTTTEQLAREIWSVHEALKECSEAGHVKRPRNAGNSWRSRVDWEAVERINHRAKGATGSRFRGLEEQMNAERSKDAAFEALKAKIGARSSELEAAMNA